MRSAQYNGLSMVFVLLDSEKQAYQKFMQEEFLQNQSLVVTQGVNFIGALSLNKNGNIHKKNITKAHSQVDKLINRWLETRNL